MRTWEERIPAGTTIRLGPLWPRSRWAFSSKIRRNRICGRSKAALALADELRDGENGVRVDVEGAERLYLSHGNRDLAGPSQCDGQSGEHAVERQERVTEIPRRHGHQPCSDHSFERNYPQGIPTHQSQKPLAAFSEADC